MLSPLGDKTLRHAYFMSVWHTSLVSAWHTSYVSESHTSFASACHVSVLWAWQVIGRQGLHTRLFSDRHVRPLLFSMDMSRLFPTSMSAISALCLLVVSIGMGCPISFLWTCMPLFYRHDMPLSCYTPFFRLRAPFARFVLSAKCRV